MDKLAYEILTAIVSLLQDDQKTLASLNRVSRQFHAISSPLLYHSPIFPTVESFQRFATHLTKQSYHVRTIDLQLTPHRWRKRIGPMLMDLSQKTKDLQRLDLSLCSFENRQLSAAVEGFPNLVYLSVAGCRFVNDTAINHVAEHCSQLEELDLSSAEITDTSLRAIADHCQHLRWLNIASCELVSEEGLWYLARKCMQLRYVNYQDCYNVVVAAAEFEQATEAIVWSNQADDDDADWTDME
ncbi:uncharacterized protein BYT42DRAFT_541805 [Radiomyces spectabilis]|uniref:uncharacterized protein n=1 Tax=Radiomyces spectabilis TaxID=64574 RepID=UPI002220A6B7|nr:uncharacterized protein BYT42DRAFT_541805 [Radiomyces spectabilis]KAI8393554.1 hypothetical protein BYT42DRAFT_541805 [Radiomyces spectabilis]